jgi:hypothetical protein
MKILVILAAILVFIGITTKARAFEGWTKKQIFLEATCELLLLADMSQTLTIARNPDRYYEKNPILGRHPSEDFVTGYFVAGMIFHPVVSYFLPPKSKKYKWINRENWQYAWIVVETGAVANNLIVGIGFSF